MFENIIGHGETVAVLANAAAEGSLPSSLLFHGPRFSAKLTTALELARVLSCTGEGAWNCDCKSCGMHRLLNHPNTVTAGSRFFSSEIAASADSFLRTGRQGAHFLFLRSVRKMLRRFDPVLWEGSEPKFKKNFPIAEKIDDLLEAVVPGRELPERRDLERILQEIVDACARIDSASAVDSVSVAQIRRISAWVHTSTNERCKVVIIDGADRMSESTRNALLKVLEEPPPGVFFILITERKGAVIPTILSRLRQYHFPERSKSLSAEVLRRIFNEDEGGYDSLRDFFTAWSTPDFIRSDTLKFVKTVLEPETMDSEPLILEELSSRIATKETFEPFLYELCRLLRTVLRGTSDSPLRMDVNTIAAWNSIIRATSGAADQLNQGPGLLFDNLYLRLREAR